MTFCQNSTLTEQVLVQRGGGGDLSPGSPLHGLSLLLSSHLTHTSPSPLSVHHPSLHSVTTHVFTRLCSQSTIPFSRSVIAIHCQPSTSHSPPATPPAPPLTDDDQFNEEKMYLIRQIRELNPDTYREPVATPSASGVAKA